MLLDGVIRRPPADGAVLGRLGRLDRFLPLRIGSAMALGLALGRLVPSLDTGLKKLQVGTGQALAGIVGPLIEVPVLVAA